MSDGISDCEKGYFSPESLRERIESIVKMINTNPPDMSKQITDAILHEIGSCGECKSKRTCPIVKQRNLTPQIIHENKTFYCSDFKREGK